jgi:hypothetical protein
VVLLLFSHFLVIISALQVGIMRNDATAKILMHFNYFCRSVKSVFHCFSFCDGEGPKSGMNCRMSEAAENSTAGFKRQRGASVGELRRVAVSAQKFLSHGLNYSSQIPELSSFPRVHLNISASCSNLC